MQRYAKMRPQFYDRNILATTEQMFVKPPSDLLLLFRPKIRTCIPVSGVRKTSVNLHDGGYKFAFSSRKKNSFIFQSFFELRGR